MKELDEQITLQNSDSWRPLTEEYRSIQCVATPSPPIRLSLTHSLSLSHTHWHNLQLTSNLDWTPRCVSRAAALAMVGGFILYAVVLSLIVFSSLEILLVVLAPILIDMDWRLRLQSDRYRSRITRDLQRTTQVLFSSDYSTKSREQYPNNTFLMFVL